MKETLEEYNLRKEKEKLPSNQHYKWCKYEPILVIEDWELGFNLGNSLKYINRAGRKANTTRLEDLRKALFYLKREVETIEKQNGNGCKEAFPHLYEEGEK